MVSRHAASERLLLYYFVFLLSVRGPHFDVPPLRDSETSENKTPREDTNSPGAFVRVIPALEVKSKFNSLRARRHIVSATERGKEIVQRGFVG